MTSIRIVSFVAALALVVAACGDDSLHGLPTDAAGLTPNDEAQCITSLDCGLDATCVEGTCVDDCASPPCGPNDPNDPPPDDPPPGVPLWVGGQWNTEYHLDLSDYLGPLAGLGSELDFLDQLLLGNSDIGSLPIIGAIIQDFVDNNIPSWVSDLVHGLNGIVHFFQDMRVDGRMSLQHVSGAPEQLTGVEVWDWGFVEIIDQCEYGEADPTYPQCALMPVPLNQFVASFGTIGAEPEDFTGSITGTEILLANREVRMQISQFVLFIIDHITRLASNGQFQTLNDALQSLIDCQGFTAQIEAMMCNSFGSCGAQPAIFAACVSTRDTVIAELTGALLAITVDWEVMQFDARAIVIDNPQDGAADLLGDPPVNPGDIENGGFRVLLGADLDGTWSAVRP